MYCICTLPVDTHLKKHSLIGMVSTSTITQVKMSNVVAALCPFACKEVIYCIIIFAFTEQLLTDILITLVFKLVA
jgi:hypothetical protein